jgi:hypothetical protein
MKHERRREDVEASSAVLKDDGEGMERMGSVDV